MANKTGAAGSFSDLEAAKAAAAMEREGLAFYQAAAKATKNPELVKVFEAMAAEEKKHLADFEDLAGELARAKAATEEYWDDPEVGEYIHAVIAQKVFPLPANAAGTVAGMASTVDALRFALGAEKDTVLFYSLCADSARGADVREIFNRLAREERKHIAMVGRWLKQAGA
ncbi:MAG TPA: ferritin family protein [Planctomycetota bacterium]|nr:ferritin family protein [Planctomycetota bacterium]